MTYDELMQAQRDHIKQIVQTNQDTMGVVAGGVIRIACATCRHPVGIVEREHHDESHMTIYLRHACAEGE